MGTKVCLWIGVAGFAGDLLLEAEPSELPLGSLFLALALLFHSESHWRKERKEKSMPQSQNPRDGQSVKSSPLREL